MRRGGLWADAGMTQAWEPAGPSAQQCQPGRNPALAADGSLLSTQRARRVHWCPWGRDREGGRWLGSLVWLPESSSELPAPEPTSCPVQNHPPQCLRERTQPPPLLGLERHKPGEGTTGQSRGPGHWWAPSCSPLEEEPPPQRPQARRTGGLGAGLLSLSGPHHLLSETTWKMVGFLVLPLGKVA